MASDLRVTNSPSLEHVGYLSVRTGRMFNHWCGSCDVSEDEPIVHLYAKVDAITEARAEIEKDQ